MTRHLTTPHNTKTQAASHRRRLLRNAITLACAVLSAATSTMLLGGTPAYAGDWFDDSCENPNLSVASSENWTSFTTGSVGFGSNNDTVCGPGDPMSAELSSDAAEPVGAGENLQYTPPPGSTLAGGSVYVGLYGNGYGYGASGTAIAYSPEFAYNGSNVILQCSSGQPACSTGSTPYDYLGVLALPINRGGNFYLGAGCGGQPDAGRVCNEGAIEGAWSLVRLWWANFLLSNSSTPAASSFGGALLAPGARGTQELAFTASDPGGPGVYTVTAQVDGKALYSGIPNSNGGKCSAVGESGGALMFAFSQPCRPSESVDIPINTAQVADGQHTLKVTVEDAAQNSSVVYDSTITTKNAPAASSSPTILAPSQIFTGVALSTHPGTWEAPAGAGSIAYGYQWEDCDAQGNNCTAIAGAQGATYTPAPSDVGHTLRLVVNASDTDGLASATSAATGAVLASQGSLGAQPGPGTGGTSSGLSVGVGSPNGTAASESAQLRLGVRRTITRTFAHRAFRLTGRLLDAQGNPIGGATLDVLQQIVGTTTLKVIRNAKTRTNGDFAVGVPAGPSRLVEVAYRAFSADTGYAAQATVRETVSAGIALHITPTRTNSTGTIIVSGRVLGSLPSQRTIVELLVHYRGHWEPIRTPHSEPGGYFQIEYQFQGALGRYPFRVVVPGGQAGFPFATGYSRPVDVYTD